MRIGRFSLCAVHPCFLGGRGVVGGGGGWWGGGGGWWWVRGFAFPFYSGQDLRV